MLAEDLAALDAFGALPAGGFTRLAWSPELRRALDWLEGRMADAGLEVEMDAAGNLIGRLDSGEGPAVVIGSHFDTVPAGGRFDGALGVLAALEAVRRLTQSGTRPRRPIWVVAFQDEEGARFDSALLGSRAFAGEAIDPRWAASTDDAGLSLAEAMRSWNRDFAALHEARQIERVHSYLELHIEQGPVLARAGEDIGLVTAITGLAQLSVRFTGTPNHAGTTPMDDRRDPVCAAARSVVAVREAARSHGFRATTGRFEAYPGTSSAIAEACEISFDIRSASAEGFNEAQALAANLIRSSAADEAVDVEIETIFSAPPVALDRGLVEQGAAICERLGLSYRRMESGAGHDAMVLAGHRPAALVFVPSEGGISHSADELTREADIESGCRFLTKLLAEVAESES